MSNSPRFKVGDRLVFKQSGEVRRIVNKVSEDKYWLECPFNTWMSPREFTHNYVYTYYENEEIWNSPLYKAMLED